MTDTAQNVFRALADPTRRDILRMLGREAMTIGQVAGQFDMTRAAIKKPSTVIPCCLGNQTAGTGNLHLFVRR